MLPNWDTGNLKATALMSSPTPVRFLLKMAAAYFIPVNKKANKHVVSGTISRLGRSDTL